MTWLDFGSGPMIFDTLAALYLVKWAWFGLVDTITLELLYRIQRYFMGAINLYMKMTWLEFGFRPIILALFT